MKNIINIKKGLAPKDFCKQITNYTGNFIRLLRKDSHIEIKNMANEVDVSVQQFMKYELGKNRLCIGRLLLILNHLEYDIHKFIIELMNIYGITYKPIERKPLFKNIDKLDSNQYKLIEKLIKDLTKNN